MSDSVLVPFGDNAGETAQKLLDAADDPSEVRTNSGHPSGWVFEVPEKVAKKAGVDTVEELSMDDQLKADEKRLAAEADAQSATPANTTDDSLPEDAPGVVRPAKATTAKKAPAKKAAAKKTTKKAAKKSTAKKSTAKKTAS